MRTGPLGSTVHVLRADAATVAALAGLDWNRSFPRVCLDPVRGLITLTTPSRLHDDLSEILSHVVDTAGSAVTGASKGLRTTRLRGPDDPPGTGMERRPVRDDAAGAHGGRRAHRAPQTARQRAGARGGCVVVRRAFRLRRAVIVYS